MAFSDKKCKFVAIKTRRCQIFPQETLQAIIANVTKRRRMFESATVKACIVSKILPEAVSFSQTIFILQHKRSIARKIVAV